MTLKQRPIRIILADDHHIVRRGLAALLQLADGRYEVVAEASDGAEVVIKANGVAADVAILDLSMPRLNGIEAARRLGRQHPTLKVIILSMYNDPEFVSQAFASGASGYVLKESLEDELFSALEAVVAGEEFVSAAVTLPRNPDKFKLTSREREILQLIAEGNTTAEIADLLAISPHTANRHRANLMQKLDVHTQAGLIRAAIEKKLVILSKPPD